jgi:ATP-binding cassette subfamily B protein
VTRSGDFWNAIKLAYRVTYQTAPKKIVAILLLSLISATFPTLQAWAWRELVNGAVTATTVQTAEFSAVLFWVGVGVVITLVQILVSQFSSYLKSRVQLDLQVKINVETFRQAAKLDFAFFENPEFEDVIERAKKNIAAHLAKFLFNFITILQLLLQTIGISVFLLWIDPFALFVIIPITVPYIWYQWAVAKARYRKDFLQTTRNRWLQFFVNCVMNHDFVPEVKINQLSTYLSGRYAKILQEFNDEDKKLLIRYDLIGNTIFELFFAFSFYLILGYAGWRVISGALKIGDLVVYARTATQMRGFMQSVSDVASSMVAEILYVRDWHAFMTAESDLDQQGQLTPSMKGQIELKSVSFRYPGTQHNTLHEVSLTIAPGETVAIVGENGAGKSTLVKLIARLYDPTTGTICVDGEDIRQIALTHYHQQLAYIPQRFNRFEATVADNIAYGDWQRLGNDPEKIREVAKRAGIHQMIEEMPSGYDTMLGRRFGNYDLSGGQWQKIAIARVLAREAKIMILDEPTSNLDAKSEYEIFSQFRQLAEGRTTLLISHRFSTISMADRIVVMHQGQIVEQGTHAELLALHGYYATMYRLHKSQIA